jgi:hypothetical protein
MPDAHDPEPQPQSRRSGLLKPPKLSDERLDEAVCEAAICERLQQPLAGAPHRPRYFVARQGRDPGDARLGRLGAPMSEVEPPSQCRVMAREGVVDRATGALGAIVQVARLSWVHTAAVDVVD